MYTCRIAIDAHSDVSSSPTHWLLQELEDTISSLKSQVNSLQQRCVILQDEIDYRETRTHAVRTIGLMSAAYTNTNAMSGGGGGCDVMAEKASNSGVSGSGAGEIMIGWWESLCEWRHFVDYVDWEVDVVWLVRQLQ